MPRQSNSNTVALYIWLAGLAVLGIWIAVGPKIGQGVVINTLLLGTGSAAFALPVGIVIWLAGSSKSTSSRLVLLFTLVVAALPPWVHVCAWDAAFGRLGWLTAVLTNRYSAVIPPWPAAIWIHANLAAPQIALILHLYQTQFDWSQEQQASLSRAPWQVVAFITLPRLIPALLAGGIWTMLICNREIAVTDIYQIGTLAEQIYLGYSLGLGGSIGGMVPAELSFSDLPLFLACSVWLLGGAWLAISQIQKALFERAYSAGNETTAPDQSPWPTTLFTVFLFLIPLANLVARAGMRTVAIDGTVGQLWSFWGVWRAIVSSIRDNLPEWNWSLTISLVGATILVAIAIFAVGISRRNRGLAFLFWGSILVVGVCPGPVIGRSLAQISQALNFPVWNWLWDRTIFGPILASGIFLWPLAGIAAWCLIRSIPATLFDVATMNGRRPQLAFPVVLGATSRRSIPGLWLLLAALYFGELSASHLVRPGGIDIIPRLALGKMHSGIDEVTASIGLVSTFVLAFTAILGAWLLTSRPYASSKL